MSLLRLGCLLDIQVDIISTHTLEPQAWNLVEKEIFIWAGSYRFGSGQHTCDKALRLDAVTQGGSVTEEEGWALTHSYIKGLVRREGANKGDREERVSR